MINSTNIEDIYPRWYLDPEESQFGAIQDGWRVLGARYKAANIARAYKPSPNDRVLDVGGGAGEVSKALVDSFSFPTTSLVEITASAAAMAAKAEQIREVTVFDGYDIPLPDKNVDFAFATHVLEHVPDPRRFLRELHRVARIVFIEVPIDYSPERIDAKHLLSYGHVNVFTPSTARFLVESENFKVIDEFPSNMQKQYAVVYYNHFFNGGINPTLPRRAGFALKWYLGLFKSRLTSWNPLPSEYCFLLSADDSSPVESLVAAQEARLPA